MSAPTTAQPRRAPIALAALALAVVTALVFSPAVRNDFVDWDDPAFVFMNKGLGDPPGAVLRWAFTTAPAFNWTPLSWLSLALDHAIGGLDPTVFHATNVLLHALSAGLVVVLLAWLLRLRGWGGQETLVGAMGGAALFALHPLRVESVAWVAERRDVLCTFFYVAALLAHLRWSRLRDGAGRGARRWYFATVALGAAALLAKSMAVTLPFALLVLDWYPLGAFERHGLRRLSLEKLPLVAMSVATGILTVAVQGPATTALQRLPPAARPLLAARAVLWYLWKTVCPEGLGPLYILPRPQNFPWFSGALCLGLVAALTALALHWRGRAPWLLATWAFFLVALAPVSGLLHIGLHWAADRYTYLPSLSLAALAAGGIALLARSLGPRLGGLGSWLATSIPVALAAAGLASATIHQIGFWRDSIALWERGAEIEPESGWIWFGLAESRWNAGDYDGALHDAERALAISESRMPGFRGEILEFMARAQLRLGQVEAAEATMQRAEQAGWDPIPNEGSREPEARLPASARGAPLLR